MIDAYVDDLIQILDALNVNRCTFIGHFASAMVGILSSICCPDRFTKLIFSVLSPSPRLTVEPAIFTHIGSVSNQLSKPGLLHNISGYKLESTTRS
ncbi:hypothetical protein Ddye_012763 [Dipteronia dyeriana]|uniref:Uncharacterized protein n=1 Tax=Dipteronia dyeriana TaxID=168575 RepID=A0AAD9X558_9ROSI|nr:hypothetical protein Ddye_012763 [Dipteronia dyeriana]